MFNLLHMDLRRLVRDRAFYIILTIFGCVLLFVCFVMAITTNQNLLNQLATLGGSVSLSLSDQQELIRDAAEAKVLLSQTNRANFFYTIFGSGGGFSVFALIFSTLFVCEDFSSGFAKNIFSVHRPGFSYVLSKSGAMLCAVTGLLVLGTAFSQLLTLLFRMPLAASGLAEFAQYFFQVWLVSAAFAVQNVFFCLLTRNAALSMIFSFLCAGGLVGLTLNAIGGLFRLDLLRFTLAGVSTGNGLSGFSVAVCLVWIGIYLLLSTLALRRKDI